MKRNLSRLKSHIRKESGQTLLLVTLCVTVLLGFLGLAIDVGNARAAGRKMQQAADAAAMAGALEIQSCSSSPCTEMSTASQQAVAENGLTVASGDVHTNTSTMPALSGTNVPVLAVNWGPLLLGSTTADPNYKSSTYVEAAVAENQPSFFASIFGISTFYVSARAEAKINNSPWCIFSQKDLEVGSGGKINANCGAYTDGNLINQKNGNKSSCNGTQITMTQIDVAGTACSSNQLSPTPVSNAPVMTDPLAYLSNFAPTMSNFTCVSTYPWGTTSHTSPGTGSSYDVYADSTHMYCPDANGIAFEVGAGDTVTFHPGAGACSGADCSTFVMKGNLKVDSKGTIQTVDATHGVSFYFNTTGTLVTNSTGNNTTDSVVGLYAPTGCSGAAESWSNLPGILLWEDKNDTSPGGDLTLRNGSKTIYQGAMYVPGATIDDESGSTGTMGAYTILDAQNVVMGDGAKIGSNYTSLCGGSPIKNGIAVLAE